MEGDVCGDEADDLTTEEELLLCGVRPGTATATWYRSLRQQLTRRHRRHSLASRVHFAPKGRDSLTHTDPYDRPNGSTSFPPTTSNNNYPLLLHANSGITSPRTRDATGGNSKNGTLMYPSLSAEGLFSPPASAHSRLATARSPSRHFGSTRFSNLTIGSSTGSIASGRRFHPGNTGGEVPPSLGQTARPLEVPRDVINCMTGAGATLVERTLPEGLREELALLRSTHSFDEPEQDAPHPPLHPRGSDGDVAPLRLMPSVGAEEAARKSGEAAEEEAENPQDVVCSAHPFSGSLFVVDVCVGLHPRVFFVFPSFVFSCSPFSTHTSFYPTAISDGGAAAPAEHHGFLVATTALCAHEVRVANQPTYHILGSPPEKHLRDGVRGRAISHISIYRS